MQGLCEWGAQSLCQPVFTNEVDDAVPGSIDCAKASFVTIQLDFCGCSLLACEGLGEITSGDAEDPVKAAAGSLPACCDMGASAGAWSFVFGQGAGSDEDGSGA